MSLERCTPDRDVTELMRHVPEHELQDEWVWWHLHARYVANAKHPAINLMKQKDIKRGGVSIISGWRYRKKSKKAWHYSFPLEFGILSRKRLFGLCTPFRSGAHITLFGPWRGWAVQKDPTAYWQRLRVSRSMEESRTFSAKFSMCPGSDCVSRLMLPFNGIWSGTCRIN